MIIQTDKYDIEFFDDTPILSIVNRLIELELKPINFYPDVNGVRSTKDLDRFSAIIYVFHKQNVVGQLSPSACRKQGLSVATIAKDS